MFYSLFLYGIIAWMLTNIPVSNGGGGVRRVRVYTQWWELLQAYLCVL